MILKNKAGKEKEFKIIYEIKKQNHTYILYKDMVTEYVYGGKLIDEVLIPLNEMEYDWLNKLFKKFRSNV